MTMCVCLESFISALSMKTLPQKFYIHDSMAWRARLREPISDYSFSRNSLLAFICPFHFTLIIVGERPRKADTLIQFVCTLYVDILASSGHTSPKISRRNPRHQWTHLPTYVLHLRNPHAIVVTGPEAAIAPLPLAAKDTVPSIEIRGRDPVSGGEELWVRAISIWESIVHKDQEQPSVGERKKKAQTHRAIIPTLLRRGILVAIRDRVAGLIRCGRCCWRTRLRGGRGGAAGGYGGVCGADAVGVI